MPTHAVLILHSNEVGWADVRAILRALPDVSIVASTRSGDAAIDLASMRRPDVILASAVVDTGPVIPVLETLRGNGYPAFTIGVFATQPSSQASLKAFAHLTVAGCAVWTDLTHETLHLFLLTLLSGDLWLSSRTPARMLSAMVTERYEPALPLSIRELDILKCLANGLTQKEIAQHLTLSERRVRALMSEVETKFDASTPFTLGMKFARFRDIS